MGPSHLRGLPYSAPRRSTPPLVAACQHCTLLLTEIIIVVVLILVNGALAMSVPLRSNRASYTARCASRISGRDSSSFMVPLKQMRPRSMM